MLLNGLRTRFPRYEYNRILAHATYLDPRFGKIGILIHFALEKIKRILSNYISGCLQSDSVNTNTSENISHASDSTSTSKVKTTPIYKSLIKVKTFYYQKYFEINAIPILKSILK